MKVNMNFEQDALFLGKFNRIVSVLIKMKVSFEGKNDRKTMLLLGDERVKVLTDHVTYTPE